MHGLIDSVYIQGKREGTVKGFIIGIIFTLIVAVAKKIIK